MSKSSSVVAWSEDYALKLPEIDEQHKILFNLLNSLWHAIVRRSGPVETLELIGELEKYTLSHFAAEETFMRVTHYLDFTEHKKQHDAFVDRVTQEKAAILGAGKPLSLDLLRFLKDWLVDHILVSDKAYANFYETTMQPKSRLGGFFKRLFG